MRVVSGTSIVVHGDGFKEWNLTIPTREGATAADAIKELQNAVSFELRSHDLMKKTIVVPNSALWRDISTHLTHGYYLFAHVHPVLFYYDIEGKTRKTRIKPCLTIQDFIGKCCPAGTVVDSDKNTVFPSVTIDLVQRLNKGIECNPMHFKVSKFKQKSWYSERVRSFRALSLGALGVKSDAGASKSFRRVEDDADS